MDAYTQLDSFRYITTKPTCGNPACGRGAIAPIPLLANQTPQSPRGRGSHNTSTIPQNTHSKAICGSPAPRAMGVQRPLGVIAIKTKQSSQIN